MILLGGFSFPKGLSCPEERIDCKEAGARMRGVAGCADGADGVSAAGRWRVGWIAGDVERRAGSVEGFAGSGERFAEGVERGGCAE